MTAQALIRCNDISEFRDRNLSIAVASATHDNDPVNARFAWGGEVLEGGFGGYGEDLLGGLEGDDAFEGRDGVLAVGRDEFRDLVSWHALFLKGRVGQLLADVVGHFNDHADRICHARFLHPLHHIRCVVIQQMPTELFGLLGDAAFHGVVPFSQVANKSRGLHRFCFEQASKQNTMITRQK
jgi:hypothetical protein